MLSSPSFTHTITALSIITITYTPSARVFDSTYMHMHIYTHDLKKNTFRIPIPIHYPIASTSTASATFFFLGIIRVGVALSLDIRHSRRHRFIIRPQSSLSFSPNLFLESCSVILLYNRLTTNLAFFVAHHCAMVTCL